MRSLLVMGGLTVRGSGMHADGTHSDDGRSNLCNLSEIEATVAGRLMGMHCGGIIHARL